MPILGQLNDENVNDSSSEDKLLPLPESVTKKLLTGQDTTDIQRSNLLDLSDAMSRGFGEAGALEPPLDPLSLVRLVSQSGTLRPLIDTMAVNIHGFGYSFEPIIDLDASDAVDRVRAAMLLEKELEAEAQESEGGIDQSKIDPPTDEEVKERIDSLREQQRREKAKLESFFSNCSRQYSFTRLSRKAQVDKESTGYMVIEVRRDGHGRISRLTYAPSWTFRALPLGRTIETESRVRSSDISYRTIKEPVRFRRYMQIYEQEKVFFKEFGDQRVMSRKTGRYYENLKILAKEEGKDARPATEVLWTSLDSSESDVYGIIRWAGCIPGVIGSREQAEVNLLFFRSKAIPPMVIMVSGGKLAKGARERLEQLIKNEIKGVENFHKILVIEAEPSGRGIGTAGPLSMQDKVKVELRPLTEAIFKDALWQGYAQNNRSELGQSFRLPPMLRGDTENLNRATAKIAREATEQLVFGPERRDFEYDIARTLLADMGIMLWRFRLNGPESTDSELLIDMVVKLGEGTISVNEARRIAAKVFGTDFPPYDADWARMPLKQSLAGMTPEPLPEETEDADTLDHEESAEDKQALAEFTEDKITKIMIPQDEFSRLVECSVDAL